MRAPAPIALRGARIAHIEVRRWGKHGDTVSEWSLTAHFRGGEYGSISVIADTLEGAQRKLCSRSVWVGPDVRNFDGPELGWLRAIGALGITHSVVRVARKADLI